MQGHFWHLFLAQFFMLFHMVALVLLSMVAFLTIFLLAENLQQPIKILEIGVVIGAAMENKMQATM